MQRVLAVLCLCISIVLISGSNSLAGHDDWRFTITAYYGQFGTNGGVGVHPQSSDDYDAGDLAIVPGAPVYMGDCKVEGQDGWNGPTGYYRWDQRAPLPLTLGAAKTWRFYVWADPSLDPSAGAIYLRLHPHQLPSSDQMAFRLALAGKPSGVTEGPMPGTSYPLIGTSVLLIDLPVFRTDNGLEGYVFEFTATVIPEPGGLLVLAGGLASVGIPMLRRRRHGIKMV